MITLANINSKTKQEVFDYVVSKLYEQAQKSQSETERRPNGQFICLYRGPNNLKCAAGHCISDDEYHKTMENRSIQSLMCDFAIENHNRLLQRLQSIHDGFEVCNWPSQFRCVAEYFELQYNFTEQDEAKCLAQKG